MQLYSQEILQWLFACFIALVQSLNYEETVSQIKAGLRKCVAEGEKGATKFGFNEMFQYKLPKVYKDYVKPSERKTSPIVSAASTVSVCFRKGSYDVLLMSDEVASTVKTLKNKELQLQEQHIHAADVMDDIVKAARAYSIAGETLPELEKNRENFQFTEDFFSVDIRTPGNYIEVRVFSTKTEKNFLQAMYAGLMAGECVVEFVKHTLVHSMVCDPIFDMISAGTAYAGFPLISAIIDFFPERDSHLAHLLTLAICLGKQAYTKMEKYAFILKNMKAALDMSAAAMKTAVNSLVDLKRAKTKGDAISTKAKDVWKMIKAVEVPGFSKVQEKFEEESFGSHKTFTQNLADVTDLLRYVQNIPGIEWASGVAFGNLLAISTGITDANEHNHDTSEAVHDHVKLPTKEEHGKIQAFFAKSKDILVKGARARDNLCEFLYNKAVTLKDKFWKKSMKEIIDSDSDMKKLADEAAKKAKKATLTIQ